MKKLPAGIVPVLVFALLVAALALGMRRDPRLLPSTLIDRPLPAFSLDTLQRPGQMVSQRALQGKVVLLNVWASWCTACRDEHPLLLELSRRGQVPIYSVDYKDDRVEAMRTLAREGDPYALTLFDGSGRAGIDLGVYGVPETLVLDAAGIVRYKHVGALSEEVMRTRILPLVARLQAGAKGE